LIDLVTWFAHSARWRRGQSAGWIVCQRSTVTRSAASVHRASGPAGSAIVRHFTATSRLTRMRQQNTRQVSSTAPYIHVLLLECPGM